MQLQQKLTLAIGTILPMVALAVYLFVSPQSARGQVALECGSDPTACEFAGQCYSNGAVSRNGCSSGNCQTCISGSWGACGSC